MGFYNYKRVMHRDDFLAEANVYVEELKAEGYGNEYEGTCDYDGDGWIVAERLLNKKDAEIQRLLAAKEAAERERDIAKLHEQDGLGAVHELQVACADLRDERDAAWAAASALKADVEALKRQQESDLKLVQGYQAETESALAAASALRERAKKVVESDALIVGASNRTAYLSHGMLCDQSRDIGPCSCGLLDFENDCTALRSLLAAAPPHEEA